MEHEDIFENLAQTRDEESFTTHIPRNLIGGNVEFVQPRGNQPVEREPYTGIWTDAEIEE